MLGESSAECVECVEYVEYRSCSCICIVKLQQVVYPSRSLGMDQQSWNTPLRFDIRAIKNYNYSTNVKTRLYAQSRFGNGLVKLEYPTSLGNFESTVVRWVYGELSDNSSIEKFH